MRRVRWQELRDICTILGCVYDRTKGDHYVMTKSGLARPVVIKMDRDLGEDIIRTNLQTLGISRKDFDRLLNRVRRQKKG